MHCSVIKCRLIVRLSRQTEACLLLQVATTRMADWTTQLRNLPISENAGFTKADIPTLEGLLLQRPARDRPLFFTGSPEAICQRLRTLMPGVLD